MALIGLAGVRRTHHIHVLGVGMVGLDVALQLVDKRVVRLFWVGKGFGSMCLRHTANYADAGTITQLPLLRCSARSLIALVTQCRRVRNPT
jgi:hypothetical protein